MLRTIGEMELFNLLQGIIIISYLKLYRCVQVIRMR